MKHILFLVLFVVFFPALSKAQSEIKIGEDTPMPSLSIENGLPEIVTTQEGFEKSKIYSSDNAKRIDPVKSWSYKNSHSSRLNFGYHLPPMVLGDINGDGKTDYFQRTDKIADDRTPDIFDDYCYKTAVYLGGKFSNEPDTLYYQFLIPTGDLNNDGFDDVLSRTEYSESYEEHKPLEVFFGSENGLVPSGISIDGTEDYEVYEQTQGFLDFNGDHFEDVILSVGRLCEIVYGGPEEDYQLHSIDCRTGIDNSINSENFISGDLDGDDRDEIIVLSGGYDDISMAVYKSYSSGKGNFEKIFTTSDISLTSPVSFVELKIIDLNADSLMELYIGDTESYYFKTDSAGRLINYQRILYNPYPIYPVGDLNNDNKIDFIGSTKNESGQEELIISFGKENLNAGLTPDYRINEFDLDPDWSWQLPDRYPETKTDFFPDYNGDGIDDFTIRYKENTLGYDGNRFILGSAGNSPTYKYAKVDNDLLYQKIYEVVGLGDLNDDGVQDFAFVKYVQKQVHIFWGGSTITEQANVVIQLDYLPKQVSYGDFNGDGIDDIVIGSNYGAKANVYFGHQDFDTIPDHVFSYEDISDEDKSEIKTGITFPRNIGDINGDNIDDILFNDNVTKAYIYFGGSELPKKPNYIIDMGEITGLDQVPGFNYSNTGVGDINGDGYDDFILGAYNLDNQDLSWGAGFLFFGGKWFSTQNMIKITMQDTASASSITGFGRDISSGGDFDGDGKNDIIFSSTYAGQDPEKLFSILKTGNIETELSMEYFGIEAGLLESFYAGDMAESFIGEAKFLDWDNDKQSEIIVIPGSYYRNPVILDDEGSIILNNVNKYQSLGNYYIYDNTAIGDFNNDGNLEIILPIVYDNVDAYQSSKVYMYSLDKILISNEIESSPNTFSLLQNYPNPFNPVTTISFELPKPENVRLEVFNMLGQKIRTLINGRMSEGLHQIQFDGGEVSSGIYFYMLTTSSGSLTKRMALIK